MTMHGLKHFILRHLLDIRQRIQNGELISVRLWPETKPTMSSTYIAIILEETSVQQALQQCLEAVAMSTTVETLHLGNLPEPDLEAALLTLARGMDAKHSNGGGNKHSPCNNLQKLYIGPLNPSNSLSGKVLTKLLQSMAGSTSLRVLDIPCRIRLPNQAAVGALAQTISQLPALARLRMHVVPRTSIERPTLRLDSLLRAVTDLDYLEITAGYPEHNPYQKPIVRSRTMAQLLERNPAIRVLSLSNFGLTSSHVRALLFQGPWPALLERLSLLHHARLAPLKWGDMLASQLQDPQHTALRTVQIPQSCLSVDVWTTLNRLGRAKLIQSTQGSRDYRCAWQDLMERAHQEESNTLLELNLDFTLIRKHPMLAIQALSLLAEPSPET